MKYMKNLRLHTTIEFSPKYIILLDNCWITSSSNNLFNPKVKYATRKTAIKIILIMLNNL
jgi:hypothetical protein